MKRFFGFLRIFTLRRWVFAVAAVATLIAAFYTIENWRGERAWATAKERLRAAGEPVTIDEWLPKPPPDEQNFMLDPVFVRRLGVGQAAPTKPEKWDYPPRYAKALDGAPMEFPYEALGNSDGSSKTDMVAIAAFLPEAMRPPAGATQQQAAQAVLKWIEQWEPDFAALMDAARTRPESYLPWLGEGDLSTRFDSLSGWLNITKILQLRALAQGTTGDGKGALDSISLMLRLARAAAAEPKFLMGYVLSAGFLALTEVPLNHCLASRTWTEPEMASLMDLLAQIDLREDFRRACRGDRFYFSLVVEELVAGGGKDLARMRPQLPGLVLTFFPRGWWRQNQVRMVEWSLEQEQRLLATAASRPKSQTEISASPTKPYQRLFALFMQGRSGLERYTDGFEAQMALVRIAVVLERYRLAHGSYPQTLDDLAPFFPNGQPTDPFSGKPPSYALVNGRPRIWSVGPNQRDDGGREDGKEADDIIWTYPAE